MDGWIVLVTQSCSQYLFARSLTFAYVKCARVNLRNGKPCVRKISQGSEPRAESKGEELWLDASTEP